MELLFWIASIGALFSYFIYPLSLAVLSRVCKKNQPSKSVSDSSSRAGSKPQLSASFIITAHNEEKQIQAKIENTLELERDGVELEIIVASDFSADNTDAIVESYADRGVILIRADQHLGKEYAQLCGIKAAQGDILIFSDSATRLKHDVLNKLMHYFSDDEIGAISSEDRFISANGQVAGEGAYVKYEMWLRSLESKCAGLVGLSGSFFAARREICAAWDIHSPSDFNTALNTNQAGKLSVSCPDVEGFYPNIKDESKEYQRKLRTAIRGMTGLSRHLEVLNPFRFGLYAYQVWSHKVMRWAVPWFMLLAFFSNLTLLEHGFYQFSMLVQAGLLLTFLSAHFIPSLRKNSLAKLVYFFYQVNFALAHAFVNFLRGKRMTTWKPSAR
jgi:glycosyltransferase involved in cell wall biosynthesis